MSAPDRVEIFGIRAEPSTPYGVRFGVTDKGRDELMRSEGYESNPLSHFRERQRINGALTMAEQAAWIRNKHQDDDSSSAQPHRFRSAE